METILTVPTAPAVTRRRLKDCCVVRAAFSPVLSSDQLYLPSSVVTVIALLLGRDEVDFFPPPTLLCVAYFLATEVKDGEMVALRRSSLLAPRIVRGL